MFRKAIALALLLSGTAHAEAEPYAVTFKTYGEPTCEAWGNRQTNDDQLWLMAFLSGASAGVKLVTDGRSDPISRIRSWDEPIAWMNKWCAENPSESVSRGGLKFLGEINSRP